VTITTYYQNYYSNLRGRATPIFRVVFRGDGEVLGAAAAQYEQAWCADWQAAGPSDFRIKVEL
jgi:hypothetical protein